MRIFLLFLLVCVGYSSYAAAAHAFGDGACNPALISDHQSASADNHNCQEAKGEEGTHDTSSHVCPDCHHCGASHHVANLVDNVMKFPSDAALFLLPASEHLSGSYLLSLLRPPKNLV